MPEPHLDHRGAITVVDLMSLCRAQGRDGLPFPFFAEPDAGQPEAPTNTAEATTSSVWSWSLAWNQADIWLDCRVTQADPTIPDIRIAACRVGDAGYLGIQRPDESIVDAYTLSAYHLNAAIADNAGLTSPGSQGTIVVPGYIGRIPGTNQNLPSTPPTEDDYDYQAPVLTAVRASPAPPSQPALIADNAVTATGVVQSRSKPARTWGTNWNEPVATWVQIRDDGDYLYNPDQRHAAPADAQALAARINKLIAANVTELRRERGLD